MVVQLNEQKCRDILQAYFKLSGKQKDQPHVMPQLKEQLKEAGFYTIPEGERSVMFQAVKIATRFKG